MKINFEKNGRKITIDGKDTPSEDDYLVIKGKYLDLTSDVSKTDFPNIKFLKNGVNKYLKSKYLPGKMILTIGYRYSENQYGTNETYGYPVGENSSLTPNIIQNNIKIYSITSANTKSNIGFGDGKSIGIYVNKEANKIKLILYEDNSNKHEYILEKIGNSEIENEKYFYYYLKNENVFNLFKNNSNKQLGLDIEFIN